MEPSVCETCRTTVDLSPVSFSLSSHRHSYISFLFSSRLVVSVFEVMFVTNFVEILETSRNVSCLSDRIHVFLENTSGISFNRVLQSKREFSHLD